MRSFAIVFLLFLLSFLGACTKQSLMDTAVVPVNVRLTAAFTDLNHIDVYNHEGEFQKTIDSSVDFQDVLLSGTYYMDFVNEDGEHSFTEDGRLAFAPMTDGATPLDGPFDIDEADAPVWEVAVDPVLEGNARLNMRIRVRDETLLPWAYALGMENEDSDEEETDIVAGPKNHTYGSGTTAMRARVIWELSYAMTGSTSTACNSSSSCWSGSSGYATGGYVDDDSGAWSSLRTAYATSCSTFVSCKDAASSCGVTCYLSTGSSVVASYAYQKGSTETAYHYKGGQCKGFQNLALYRSGVYHNGSSSYTWKTAPSYSTVRSNTTTYPRLTTTSSLAAGDVIADAQASSEYHAAIVVSWSGTTANVVDSNWTGGNGTENISYHTLSFSGSGTNSDLARYSFMNCVYNTYGSQC